MANNNPDRAKMGCPVPLCRHNWCDSAKYRICALRKYYLLELAELEQDLLRHQDEDNKQIITDKLERYESAKEN